MSESVSEEREITLAKKRGAQTTLADMRVEGCRVALAADRLLVRCFPKEAKKFLEDMAHAAEMFGTSRDHAVLWGLTGNAMSQYEGTDWDEALGRVRDSVSKLSEAEPCVHYARMLFDLGLIHFRLGHHDEAYRYFNMARGLPPDADHGDESQVVYFPIRLRCYLSLPLIFRGKLTEAKKMVEEALELCSQLTTYHPDRTTLLNNLGLIYERSGDNQDLALHFYRQSLQERRGLPSMPPSDLVPLIINVGMQYIRRGRLDEAMVHLQEALEIRKQCGWLHYNTALTLKNLARVCILRQDFQGAEDYLLKSRSILEKCTPQHEQRGHVSLFLAHVYVTPSLYDAGQVSRYLQEVLEVLDVRQQSRSSSGKLMVLSCAEHCMQLGGWRWREMDPYLKVVEELLKQFEGDLSPQLKEHHAIFEKVKKLEGQGDTVRAEQLEELTSHVVAACHFCNIFYDDKDFRELWRRVEMNRDDQSKVSDLM
ncbi:kinesin light chain 4-like isoform X2 [Pomacea canaliculata]|uniref:kinesin light chain 4-like isoform X2 n=1 Tax=Pomacea canaliculata TaxID=400727 RepID=UPI000D73FADC|nr:kinesin light chain 4-like isoform X2 [Pomacea canaliculata]